MRTALRSALIRAAALREKPRSVTATAPQSILLIRPDHLGDVLFLTPALRALRLAQPNARITALVGGWAKVLLDGNPDLDAVETLDFPFFDRKPKQGTLSPYRALYHVAARIKGRFDTAVICRFDHWWGAWLAAAAGIPRIIGYAVPDVLPFLTEPIPYSPGHHEVIQNLILTGTLGTPRAAQPDALSLRFVPSAADRARAVAVLASYDLSPASANLIAIHPGSGAAVKRWDVAKWGALMQALHARDSYRFVVTGGPDEIELAAAVVQAGGAAVQAVSLAGQVSLPELAALYEHCACVIGPDSGPLHLAVAVGTPTVHLYGPVSPQTFGPWGSPHRHQAVTQHLACQYCHRLDWRDDELPQHPCISGLPITWVLEAVERVLV